MMKKTTASNPVEILLIDDNEGDIFLTKRAFQKMKISNDIAVAMDGEEALDVLLKACENEDMPIPDLILLDLNLPKKDGIQVLSELKNHTVLRRIPVIILSSSKAEQDVLKSYDLQASGYIIKPIEFGTFHRVVSAIENFWFDVVILPTET